MNNYLSPIKSNSLIFTSLMALVIAALLSLSGCQPNPAPAPSPINLDSVRPHVIPIAQARWWTARFRERNDSLRKHCPEFKDSLWLPRAEAFNSDLMAL